MNPVLTIILILVAYIAATIFLYFGLNTIADMWERVMKRPFTLRRFIKPFLIISLVLNAVLLLFFTIKNNFFI